MFGLGDKEVTGQLPKNASFNLTSNGHYVEGTHQQSTHFYLPHVTIPTDVAATMGCGLWEHSVVRKVFFTRNGKILGK